MLLEKLTESNWDTSQDNNFSNRQHVLDYSVDWNLKLFEATDKLVFVRCNFLHGKYSGYQQTQSQKKFVISFESDVTLYDLKW